jgi:hypothetical protein
MRIRYRSTIYPKPISTYDGRRFRRIALAILTLMITLAGLIIVSASPIALRSLSNLPGFDWAKLGNVGQAYGAISALLVVLGLTGVAVTMLLQIRESRHGRVQVARNRQHDLVKMAMSDPIYMSVVGSGRDFDERRQASYANLWVQFWLMLWEFGDLSEAELRSVLAKELFSSTAGRHAWEQFRHIRNRDDERRIHRRFYDILDQEYESVGTYTKSPRANPQDPRSRRALAVTVGAWIATVLIMRMILRRIIRRP